ncbi:hypothetical protein D3C71_1471220 [compost metagenome]
MADVRAGVHFHHLLGLLGEAAQHHGHVAGGGQHLAGFILAGGLDVDRQIATGDRLDSVHGLAERARDGARDHHAHYGSQQRQQHDAADDRVDAVLVRGVGAFDAAGHHAVAELAQVLERGEQRTARRARLFIGNLLGSDAVAGSDGVLDQTVGLEVIGGARGNHFVQLMFLVAGRQQRVGGQLGVDDLAGVGHALVVVGDRLRLVQHGQLGHFVGAELAELRAHLAQVLDRGNVVGAHRAQLGVGFAQADQGEAAQGQRHQRGESEAHRQLAGDGQVVEPLHD